MLRSSLPQRKPAKSAKADAGLRCRQHLQWVRGHVCTVCGTRGDEGNKIEAAHVRRAANSGVSIKPSDAFTVPLCAACHRESHRGEKTFEAKNKVDLMAIAQRLFRKSPHRANLADPWGAR
ncbi:DUF968 domain-containing protein [Sphingomonas yabuuchiae]|uniref:DUF968 domain-containing protein n=1 Tax=Sphingomonas yabuuchiae TaxID=172044 RepID=A0AA40ZYD3_9SPHN|nr:DUF968 domain-containing protein [Sphingomonas yabuuchiae]MBB4611656.1 putative HNH restriction endonuclease [Sphingomonas yabuuchiae]MBN3556756.1 DUF968 domain-containing protein [Sphingomonas yabuuchiae]